MKPENPMRALFGADEQTLSRIAALCRADWKSSGTFERALRKSRGESVPPIRVRHREGSGFGAFVTAACLTVTLAGAAGVAYLHRAAPASQNTLEQETAPALPQETDAPTETAAATERTPVIVLPSETETAPAAETAVQNELKPTETELVTEFTEITETQMPVIETYPVTEPEPVTESESESLPTEPPTEPPTEQPTEEPPAPSDSAAPPPGESPESPASFVETQEGIMQTVRCEGGEEIPLADAVYSLDLADFTMQETETNGNYRRFLLVQSIEIYQIPYTVDCFPYSEFYFSYRPDLNETQRLAIGGRQAYLVCTASDTPGSSNGIAVLFWDNGASVSLVSASVRHMDDLLRIAEHLSIS